MRAAVSEGRVGNDLNIDSEHEVIFFLNYYYINNQNIDIDIDTELIPNIRILTLSIPEINDVANIDLLELPTYKKLIDKSSNKGDVVSRAHLIINYPNISIPRNSVVINEFNKRDEIPLYYFGEQLIINFNKILPIFPAVIIDVTFGRLLKLRIRNNIISAEINLKFNNPIDRHAIGSMILIVDSLLVVDPILNRNVATGYSYNTCLINKYNIIFEHVPKIFYR